MSEYLLFAGHHYYPDGGAADFRFRGSVDECKAWFAEHWYEIKGNSYVDNWGQIVDPVTMKVIWEGHQDSGASLGEPGEVTWRRPDNS